MQAAAFDDGQPGLEAFGIPGLPVQPGAEPVFVPLSKQFGLGARVVPVVSLPVLDHAALLAEDLKGDARKRPMRVGVARPFTLAGTDGVWTPLPDGGRLWTCDVRSEGAYGVRAQLVGMQLPEGALLVVFEANNPAGGGGVYEGAGDFGTGVQYTPTIWSDTARLELYMPPGTGGLGLPFGVDTLQHIYRDVAKSAPADPAPGPASEPVPVPTPRAGNCHRDVTCEPAWANQSRAVALYYLSNGSGTFECTGQLLSTTSNDMTPYFLTASHCVDTPAVANTVDAYWLYQTATCNGTVPALASVPRTTGAVLVATRSTSDSTLLRLTGLLPGGLFYMGWTGTVPVNGTAVAGIHHPSGSWKRISFGTVSRSSTCAAADGQINAESLRTDWTTGVTEGGSSGSGIMTNDANKQLVGVLSCGSSACGAPASFQYDTYGRFAPFLTQVQTALNGFPDDSLEPNDTCAAARFIDLATAQSYTGLVVKAVNTDWYRFNLPAGAQLNASLSFTATTGNIDMKLYTTCGGAAVTQSISTTGAESISYLNSTGAAVEVYLNVYLTGTAPLNTYSMNASRTLVPVNNTCANAIALTAGTTITGTNAFATIDGSSSCVTTQQPDVWYSFTAPAAGALQIDTCGSAVDTVLSILNNGCGGTSLACSNDAGAGTGPCGSTTNKTSYASATLTSGQSVHIRVATAVGTPQGTFNLRTDFVPTVPPPSNDACTRAIAIAPGTYSFDTTGATTEGTAEVLCTAFGHNGIDKDIWYSFAAPSNGTLLAQTCGTNWDTRIASYATCPGSTDNTATDCDDDASPMCSTGSPLASRLTAAVVRGQVVLLRVGGYRNSVGTVAFGGGTLQLAFTPDPCGLSDVSGPGQAPGADGDLTADDIIVYLNGFFAGNPAADVAGPGQSAGPDGDFTADDIIVFLNRFFTGC